MKIFVNSIVLCIIIISDFPLGIQCFKSSALALSATEEKFDILEHLEYKDEPQVIKIMHTDYNNCLVNVSNSILKSYGITTSHDTLRELDKYLEKNYKNVILILYDGFGSNLIKRNIGEKSFLYKNKIKDITSVFPATTVAATTSLLTGNTPMEHCWLGWDMYIKSIDKTVTMYENVIKGTHEKVANYSVAKEEFPYVTIIDKINKKDICKVYYISPYDGIYYDSNTTDEMYDKIIELCKNNEKKFIYAYCREPDHLMHICGTQDDNVIQLMNILDQKTKQLCDKLEDTLIIVTADHGHITSGDCIILDDYPTLQNMLIRETSLESRATNFFVKNGMLDNFKKEFNKLFGNYFILLSKHEVINKKLFGTGIPHEKFDSCLGDYLAIALSDKYIVDRHQSNQLKGLHAGITEDEVLIPLIVIEKKRVTDDVIK